MINWITDVLILGYLGDMLSRFMNFFLFYHCGYIVCRYPTNFLQIVEWGGIYKSCLFETVEGNVGYHEAYFHKRQQSSFFNVAELGYFLKIKK